MSIRNVLLVTMRTTAVLIMFTTVATAETRRHEGDDGSSWWFGGKCEDESDCYGNGDCLNERCACDAAWSGSDHCDVLRFNRSETHVYSGYHNKTEASWGGNAVYDEDSGTYHLFVAQIANGCGLGSYGTNSMVIRAESSDPGGPYTFKQIVVEPFAHNPTVRKLPNKEGYVVFFIGSGDESPSSVVNCSTATPPEMSSASFASSTSSIHAVHATSIYGPWSSPVSLEFPINTSSSQWGPEVTNPSPHVESDGSVTMALQREFTPNEGKELIGVARASTWQGPYRMITETPIEPEHFYCVAGTGEDPFLWKTDRGYHMLYHGMCPTGFLEAHYAFSANDGRTWTVSPRKTYPYEFYYANQMSHFFARVERPQLVFNENGTTPLYLSNGVCDGSSLSDIDECLFKQDGMVWTAFRALSY